VAGRNTRASLRRKIGCGQKSVDAVDQTADLLHRLLAVGFRKKIQKDIVALKGYQDGHVQRAFDLRDAAADQQIGQHDQIGSSGRGEPTAQPVDFFALVPVLAAEHGDGQGAQFFGIHLDASRRDPAEKPWLVEQAVDQRRQMAEQGELLLEKTLTPPKKTRSTLTSSSSVRIGVYVGISWTSTPIRVSAAASVLSCMQLPQNIPAAPAVR
jgi:hypothetical protein